MIKITDPLVRLSLCTNGRVSRSSARVQGRHPRRMRNITHSAIKGTGEENTRSLSTLDLISPCVPVYTFRQEIEYIRQEFFPRFAACYSKGRTPCHFNRYVFPMERTGPRPLYAGRAASRTCIRLLLPQRWPAGPCKSAQSPPMPLIASFWA